MDAVFRRFLKMLRGSPRKPPLRTPSPASRSSRPPQNRDLPPERNPNVQDDRTGQSDVRNRSYSPSQNALTTSRIRTLQQRMLYEPDPASKRQIEREILEIRARVDAERAGRRTRHSLVRRNMFGQPYSRLGLSPRQTTRSSPSRWMNSIATKQDHL